MAKQNKDLGAEEALLDESSEPRVYELGFHLDPELPTEEVKKAYRTVRDVIESKGTIVAEGEPQMIQLAYTISRQAHSDKAGRRDFDSAYFSWIVYEATAESHAEVLSAVGADTHLIRFIDLITTKDAARHSVEMRELAEKMAEPRASAEPEDAASAELDAALENVVV